MNTPVVDVNYVVWKIRFTWWSVCALDNKIYVMGGGGYTCEMLDLNDDDPEWRYIAEMNRILHNDNSAVVIEKNVYVVGGEGSTNSVEVYDADKGR